MESGTVATQVTGYTNSCFAANIEAATADDDVLLLMEDMLRRAHPNWTDRLCYGYDTVMCFAIPLDID